MLYYLSTLSKDFGPLRVFEYSTFRGVAAAFTAFLISVVFGKRVIRKLISLKFGQPVRTREEVNQLFETHGRKKGTPDDGRSAAHRQRRGFRAAVGKTDEPAGVGRPLHAGLPGRARALWTTISRSPRRIPRG